MAVDSEKPQNQKFNNKITVEEEFEKIQINEVANSKEKQDSEKDDFSVIQLEDEDMVEDVPDTSVSQKQANSYAAKKTVAQGMMDIALITANANQLRYIIEFNRHSSTFYLNLILIVISLFLQVAVGVSLIFKGRMDLRGESKHQNAKRINNYVVIGIFLVTIINVFIASFTVTSQEK
ncbi:ninjurin-A-like [Tribolium madens]|uniref:ninjurin-A-like n=1 Tax=Tribolium madens TaxID=41895 RepID=UPI001CF7468C|nr:ninjurin-A-like [Tribolium madens]